MNEKQTHPSTTIHITTAQSKIQSAQSATRRKTTGDTLLKNARIAPKVRPEQYAGII